MQYRRLVNAVGKKKTLLMTFPINRSINNLIEFKRKPGLNGLERLFTVSSHGNIGD